MLLLTGTGMCCHMPDSTSSSSPPACTRPHTKSANDSFGSGLENRAVELVRRLRRVRAQPAIWSYFGLTRESNKRPYKLLLY